MSKKMRRVWSEETSFKTSSASSPPRNSRICSLIPVLPNSRLLIRLLIGSSSTKKMASNWIIQVANQTWDGLVCQNTIIPFARKKFDHLFISDRMQSLTIKQIKEKEVDKTSFYKVYSERDITSCHPFLRHPLEA